MNGVRVTCMAGAVVAALAAPAAAQTRPAPSLIVSIFGGVAGSGDLWSIARQPLSVLQSSMFDTLSLARRVTTGIAAGVTVTYFPTPHLGLSVEGTYLGLGVDDDCTALFINEPFPGEVSANEQICDDIRARGRSATTAGFYAGPTLRIAPRGAVRPYLKVNVGLSIRSSSLIETAGRFATTGGVAERPVIQDAGNTFVNPSFLGAAGVTVPISPGYQFRMEVRDHILRLQRVTAPADALGMAPTEGFFKNTLGLVVALDIILEQRRGRRY